MRSPSFHNLPPRPVTEEHTPPPELKWSQGIPPPITLCESDLGPN